MPDLWLIDAFAERPFTGNPAGVCFLDRAAPTEWMQSVAMELNQAETAFLVAENDGYRLRWFTPAAEVDLCGHATLASAHYLWTTGRADHAAPARFDTRSGRLVAHYSERGVILDFPATPPVPTPAPTGLLDALGVDRAETLVNQVRQPDYLVVLEDTARLRALTPAFGPLAKLACRGVIVTAPGDRPGLDFVSRFFAPALGIDEDPVTGSAHCTLGPFWSGRLGRPELVGWQASRRGGRVATRLAGDRVELTGQARTMLTGTIDGP
jgi:PhzF family phenazine biosynthesis protein